MKRWLNTESILVLGLVSMVVTACGQNANLTKHLGTANVASNEQKKTFPSPSPSPSHSESVVVSHGYSLCQASLEQLPMIQKDNELAGRDVLSFVQFDASGKVVLSRSDSAISFTEKNCKNDIERIGFKVSDSQSEEISFTYQDGKVKEVLVQHYQDGAWLRDKVTFILSSDESTCYVQHSHSDVEVSQTITSTVDFDLETCRLAGDVSNDPAAQAAVLKNGGLASIESCESDFAKAVLAQYGNGPDASFHNEATAQPCPAGSPCKS